MIPADRDPALEAATTLARWVTSRPTDGLVVAAAVVALVAALAVPVVVAVALIKWLAT